MLQEKRLPDTPQTLMQTTIEVDPCQHIESRHNIGTEAQRSLSKTVSLPQWKGVIQVWSTAVRAALGPDAGKVRGRGAHETGSRPVTQPPLRSAMLAGIGSPSGGSLG